MPAEKLAEGWERIDDRLIFLMVRLASTETSLEAIDKALVASGRSQSHIAYFFDGKRVAKTEKTLSTAVSTFRVGGTGEPPSEYSSNFIADIDELYFFDIALTDSQVNELYLRSTSLSTKKK